jgi:hypothetical protein
VSHQLTPAPPSILYERIRQLEARPNDAGRLSALPTDLDAQKANYFTQTVLGVFYEPKGLAPERHRPVRSAATAKNDPHAKPDSAGDGRRASKRQKTNTSVPWTWTPRLPPPLRHQRWPLNRTRHLPLILSQSLEHGFA